MDIFDSKSRIASFQEKFFELCSKDSEFLKTGSSIDDLKKIYFFLEKNQSNLQTQAQKLIENDVREKLEQGTEEFSLEKIINLSALSESGPGAYEIRKAENKWLAEKYKGAIYVGGRNSDGPQRKISIIIDDLAPEAIETLVCEVLPYIKSFSNTCSLFLVKSNQYRMTLAWPQDKLDDNKFMLWSADFCVERTESLEKCCQAAYNLEARKYEE